MVDSDSPDPTQPRVMATIDRAKLRSALQRLGDEYVFYMLHDALELLPEAELARLVGRYMKTDQLRPAGEMTESLLVEVGAFDRESRARRYYESFRVNSQNCNDCSKGTRAFIVECHRLTDRCLKQAESRDALAALLAQPRRG
jgi:hypothetical protein